LFPELVIPGEECLNLNVWTAVVSTLGEECSHALIGDAPPQAVADTAHGAWVRFVADGDPGWPRYNTANRSTALIDEGITVADDPDGAEREVWASRR
jgi:para-nitrobenzyl esterase